MKTKTFNAHWLKSAHCCANKWRQYIRPICRINATKRDGNMKNTRYDTYDGHTHTFGAPFQFGFYDFLLDNLIDTKYVNKIFMRFRILIDWLRYCCCLIRLFLLRKCICNENQRKWIWIWIKKEIISAWINMFCNACFDVGPTSLRMRIQFVLFKRRKLQTITLCLHIPLDRGLT